ncbi:hypothetical protein AX17_001534 [Amanita inopinata Kibby_2008]|nr:hypothetical protein AX17_001534 [Amanita inopinata Kibby_2008]
MHSDPKILIYARILGYLILEGPSDEACTIVAKEVLSCVDEDALTANGKFYFDHFIRPFKKEKCCTPTPSSHSSQSSFDIGMRDNFLTPQIIEAPQNHRDAKTNALIRDSYCCVVTGYIDLQFARHFKPGTGDVVCVGTNCAHIFDEPTNTHVAKGSKKLEYATSVWPVLEKFGYRNIFMELNGAGMHHLENVITLTLDLHGLWDSLFLCFEATEKPNTYRLWAPHRCFIAPHYKTIIEFTTPDPKKLPLPSPVYLAIHASCCKVANLSGAAQYIQKILNDLEYTQVLSEDGASAELLTYALSSLDVENLPVDC